MQKIEDYINTLHIDDATIKITIDADTLAEAFATLVHQSTLENVSPFVRAAALSAMSTAIINYNPVLRGVIQTIDDHAKELMYLEMMRNKHGDQVVNDVLDAARASGQTFYHCMNRYELQQSLETFNTKMKELLSAVSNIFEVPKETINNRHNRRSSKHSTPIKDGDQRWKDRDRHRKP